MPPPNEPMTRTRRDPKRAEIVGRAVHANAMANGVRNTPYGTAK